MLNNITVAEHLTSQHSAIKMLHSRVRLLLNYARAVQAGELPPRQDVLRDAYSLSHHLPVIDSERFKADFYNVSKMIKHFQVCFNNKINQ
jgi:COP9 signalosome complex subunit 6